MILWRLSIVDGKFGKPEGIALARAVDAETTRRAIEQDADATTD